MHGWFLKYKPCRIEQTWIQKEVIKHLSQTSEQISSGKKGLITLLLFISCSLSAYLLLVTEPTPVFQLHSPQQLDSLITVSFREFNISGSRIRSQEIEIDSSFTRKRFIVEVDRGFSKTSFHYHLHQRLWPYNIETIGRVEFPDKDLNLHVAFNNTIHRTIYLYTNEDSEDL